MNTVKLYYPSVTQDNKPIDQAVSIPLYKSIIKDICAINNGVSVTPVQGYYVNDVGVLINDDISLISTFTDNLESTIKVIKESAQLILKSLDQESVLIEVDNKIEFIR
jgi:hypothetical protein